jgi:hypothetical protein
MFLLYINDMSAVSNALIPILFADDTNVFIESTNMDNMIRNMNYELAKLLIWLRTNKLFLTLKKLIL